MIRDLRYFLAVICFPVAGMGCTDKPARNARDLPGSGGQVIEIDSLKFDTAELKKRFTAFDDAARQFAGSEFDYRPYQKGGNFIEAVWAKGIGFTEPCVLRGSRESLKGIHRISVDTIVVPFPRAKSAALGIEVVAPNPEDWCINFGYREATQQQVTDPGWMITFYRWNPARLGIIPFRPLDQAKERITLPVRSYTVSDSKVEMRSELSIHDDFVRHFRSAEVMRDVCRADLARLEERVRAFIKGHKAQKRVYAQYEGGGLPPPYHLEPLTAEEEEAQLVYSKRFFAAQAKLMRDHHKAMYALLRKSFPFERCWLELEQ